MSKQYNPLEHSVVQSFNGDRWNRFEAADFHEALLTHIQSEIERVHWNVYQERWEGYGDPAIPGIHWQSYVWDCGCPDEWNDNHIDTCIRRLPNFKFEDVEINWYKYPGRGMSINKDLSETEWREWFDRCLCKIREYDANPLDPDDREKTRAKQDSVISKRVRRVGR